MAKLWSTENILGRDNMELLVWHHMINHCSLKSLLRLSKRGVIPRKYSKIIKISPCVACLFGRYHKTPWRIKENSQAGKSGNPQRPYLGI